MRACVAFLAGFVAGMLFLLVLLWSQGSLHSVRATAPSVGQPAIVPPGAPVPPPPIPPSIPPQAELRQSLANSVPDLIVPVAGADLSKITDTFNEMRDGHRHEAIDIIAPLGTPVLAAGGGTIVKLFLSHKGGITIYEFDPTLTWCYYYAVGPLRRGHPGRGPGPPGPDDRLCRQHRGCLG
jgi:hypothetical protein